MVMWGSDSRIDARVVVGDEVGAGIVSRETFWCWGFFTLRGVGLVISVGICAGDGLSPDCRFTDWLSVDCKVSDCADCG